MARSRLGLLMLASLSALILTAAEPGLAQAHGPIAPIASSYLAKVGQAPTGIEAKVVDGDQRMWLSAPPSLTVVVLDYRGAPYLRFWHSRVEVNQNSAMYYLNQTPVALRPPSNLGPRTPPRWQRVSSGHSYGWHDGRLHALASVALAPGATFVGTWRVPVLVDGRLAAISGALWHAANPPIVWFWPIAVLFLCVLAAWRVRRPSVDRALARGLGIAALIALSVAVAGRDLHGRPSVSVLQLIELALVLAFAAGGMARLLFQRPGYFSYFVIAVVALWRGAELIPTLLQGFALTAIPGFLARTSAVLCLGAGLALLPLVFRLAEAPERSPAANRWRIEESEEEDDSAWGLV